MLMFNSILNINKHFIFGSNVQNNARHFYQWLIIMFNGVDHSRVEQFGPDRACAEWLLKNGASVKWKGENEFMKDYNSLRKEKEEKEGKYYLQAVDATGSAIHHVGFPHFSGCKYIEEIKLVKCSYIQNEAMPLLSLIKGSLKNLEVIECKNITDDGLLQLKDLKNLSNLKLGKFPYVKDKSNIISELTASLPECKITYEDW